jgi:hypothetical protein
MFKPTTYILHRKKVTKRATPLAVKIACQGGFLRKIGVLGALPLTRESIWTLGVSNAYLATHNFILYKNHDDSTCTNAVQTAPFV